MRRFIIPLFFSVLLLPVSCEDWNNPDDPNGKPNINQVMTDFYFGPANEDQIDKDNSLTFAEKKKAKENPTSDQIKVFNDSLTFAGMTSFLESQPNYRLTDSDKYNNFPLSRGKVRFFIRPIPGNVMLSGFSVESSDPEILEVTENAFDYVEVKTYKSGYVNLTVRASTKNNTIERVYPVKIVNSIDLRFYITPYWFGYRKAKIFWKPVGMTDWEHAVVRVRDSLTCIGYCEYYDLVFNGSKPIVKRDTICFRSRTHYELMKFGVVRSLRDITNVVRYYHYIKSEPGRAFFGASILPCFYHYILEQVKVDFDLIAEDNMYHFTTSIKAKGLVKWFTLQECTATEEEYKEDYIQSLYDEEEDIPDTIEENSNEDADDVSDIDWERKETQYFNVEVTDFYSEHQRDSVGQVVSDFKRECGYNDKTDPHAIEDGLSKLNDDQDNRQAELDSLLNAKNNGSSGSGTKGMRRVPPGRYRFRK